MSSKGVWIMGMDHGVWIACGPGVWIGTLHFELQPIYHLCTPYTHPNGMTSTESELQARNNDGDLLAGKRANTRIYK